jgi:uncharacterized phiE125 gp8 family phage protein
MDANLIWEFYDHTGVLRFTATPFSTPPIVAGVDAVSVTGIPLAAFSLGVVSVKLYGRVGGIDTFPSPDLAYAFEIIADDSLVIQLRTLLHLDDATQDVLLLSLITSAAEYASKYLGRTLLSATRVKEVQAPTSRGLSASQVRWPTILLTYPPVVAITRVYAKDVDGEETDIDAADYWLNGTADPPELQLTDWYWENLLRVVYTCGYGVTYNTLPVSIQRGILLHAAYMFKYRGDCPDGDGAVKSGAVAAYGSFRVVRR